MTPGTLNIRTDQGTVWRRRIRLRTGTVAENVPIDLTGYTIQAQVREVWTAETFVQMQVENRDDEAGAFDLVLDDQARALVKPLYRWDILLTRSGGEPVKYLEGSVKVRTTITRIS